MLQFHTYSFDTSVMEIFTGLTRGARITTREKDRLLGNELIDFLRSQRISYTFLPPALLQVVSPEGLTDLEDVMTAGDVCPWTVVQKWAPGRRLWNDYGPTENTVDTSFYLAAWPSNLRSLPIGKPSTNIECYILDPQNNVLPVGCCGELHVSGKQLARGYRNRNELTMEKFPIKLERRMYCTGDLVRYFRDGNMEYIGRVDFQVKIRGFRIELGEIETVALSSKMIVDVVAVTSTLPSGDKCIVLYLVMGLGYNDQEFRTLLSQKLPAFMLPSAIMPMTSFPLNQSGKVDRQKLPPPVFTSTIECEPLETPTEMKVASVWRSVVGVSEIGRNSDFFAVGGHSLQAVRVSAMLREEFSMDITLKQIFEYPVLRDFAQALDDKPLAGGPAIIRLVTRKGLLPLSGAQHRMWLLSQIDD